MNDNDIPNIPAPANPLFEKVKAFLKQNYEPVQSMKDADTHLTTEEVVTAINRLSPGSAESDSVARWLHECGFTFADFGNMRFEWLFKSLPADGALAV